MNQTKLPSVSTFFNEIISKTYSKFSRIYQLLLPSIVVIAAALVLLMTLLGSTGIFDPAVLSSGIDNLSLSFGTTIVLFFIRIIIGAATIVGGLAVLLDLIDTHFAHQTVPQIYSAILKKFWPLTLTYLGVLLLTSGGTLLLIIPGLVLGIMCMFALPLVIIEDLSFEKAIARSRALTENYKWGIFGRSALFGLVIVILLLIAVLLSTLLGKIHPIVGGIFMFASFVTILPSIFSATAIFYKHLTHLEGEEKKSKPFKLWFIIVFIILGVGYFIVTGLIDNSASRKSATIESAQQAAQTQMDAATAIMEVPADASLPAAPVVQ